MKLFLVIFFTCFFLKFSAQDWETPKNIDNIWDIDQEFTLNKYRRNILITTGVSAYSVSLVSLNELWYSDFPRSKFHFINDNNEWLQMDKLGHVSVSYYTGVAGIKAYEWAGFSRNSSIWYGGITGTVFLTIVEVLDGTSKQWGASIGDLAANATGSALAIWQALKWNEQRIHLKYSYSPSKWAISNPSQLGSNHLERALKDYNGQTYWLTFNIKSIFNIDNENFPKWLSIALGYGGEGMTTPYSNEINSFSRQYYLSFDVDLNKIDTKSKFFNSLLHTFGFLKFPTPAFEIVNGNFSFHPFYY